jgi:hypothetical protein
MEGGRAERLKFPPKIKQSLQSKLIINETGLCLSYADKEVF